MLTETVHTFGAVRVHPWHRLVSPDRLMEHLEMLTRLAEDGIVPTPTYFAIIPRAIVSLRSYWTWHEQPVLVPVSNLFLLRPQFRRRVDSS